MNSLLRECRLALGTFIPCPDSGESDAEVIHQDTSLPGSPAVRAKRAIGLIGDGFGEIVRLIPENEFANRNSRMLLFRLLELGAKFEIVLLELEALFPEGKDALPQVSDRFLQFEVLRFLGELVGFLSRTENCGHGGNGIDTHNKFSLAERLLAHAADMEARSGDPVMIDLLRKVVVRLGLFENALR